MAVSQQNSSILIARMLGKNVRLTEMKVAKKNSLPFRKGFIVKWNTDTMQSTCSVVEREC